MAPRRRPPPPPPRWNRRATLVVFSAIVGLVVGAGLWLATTSTRLPSREQTRAGSARLVAHAATRPVAARPATLRDSYGDDDEEGDGGEGNAAALSKRPGAKIASPDFMVDEEALRETATLTAPPKPTRPARPLNWRKAYEQWASLRAEAVIRAIHDDLSQPVRPLTKAEAQFLEGAYWLPPQFLEEEETVKAVLSWETQRGAAMKRHPTPALEAKYCTAGQPAAAAAGEAGDAPACRRYIARVPDRGSRIGHYFDTWHNTYSLALQYNLTFLYHPLLANQPEQVLFERFFGFGYDEPFRYYETCTYGAVGEECGRYLPCLKVRAPRRGGGAADRRRWALGLMPWCLAAQAPCSPCRLSRSRRRHPTRTRPSKTFGTQRSRSSTTRVTSSSSCATTAATRPSGRPTRTTAPSCAASTTAPGAWYARGCARSEAGNRGES